MLISSKVIKLRPKPTNITSKKSVVTPTFIIPNESYKPSQQTISFLCGENVVYAILKANAWRGVTADNCPVVLIFKKKLRTGLIFFFYQIGQGLTIADFEFRPKFPQNDFQLSNCSLVLWTGAITK